MNVHLSNVWKSQKLFCQCPKNVNTVQKPTSHHGYWRIEYWEGHGAFVCMFVMVKWLLLWISVQQLLMTSDFLPQWLKSKQWVHHGEAPAPFGAQRRGWGRGIQTNEIIWEHLKMWTFGAFFQNSDCLSLWEKDIQGRCQEAQNNCILAQDRGMTKCWEFASLVWRTNAHVLPEVFVLLGPLFRCKYSYITHGYNHHVPNKTHILEYSTVLFLDPKTLETTTAFRIAVGTILTHWVFNETLEEQGVCTTLPIHTLCAPAVI